MTSWFARQDLSLASVAERRVVQMVSDLRTNSTRRDSIQQSKSTVLN